MPAEIKREAAAKPVVKGETGTEIAGNLIVQQHRTRAALKRSVQLYNDCRV
jgi:hypothetical protein